MAGLGLFTYFLVERAMSVKTSFKFFKMMFFEKDGSSKGWPWQSVARFFARRGPVCAVRKTSRQARRASFIVFYLVIIKNRGSFCELRFFLEPWRSFCASWIGVCGSHDVSRLDWFVL